MNTHQTDHALPNPLLSGADFAGWPGGALNAIRRRQLAGFGVLLAAIGLAASLVISHSPWEEMPDLLQGLPLLSATLGVLAGMLALASTRITSPAGDTPEMRSGGGSSGGPAPDHAPNAPSGISNAGLLAVVQALRDLLADERRALSSLRELSSKGTEEALALAERVAGVALDAELRLNASVVSAESALRHPSAAATRAADAASRAERVLARTETVLRSLPEATAMLQRETAGLNEVARQIAMVSRTALSQTNEAARQTAQNLSEAGQQGATREDISVLASLTLTLQKAAAGLAEGTSALDAAGQRVAEAGTALAGQLAAGRGPVPAAGADLSESALGGVAASITLAAAGLKREADMLSQAARQIATNGAEAVAAVSSVAAEAALRLSATLPPESSPAVPADGAEMMQAASELQQHAAALRDVGHDIICASHAAVAAVSGAASTAGQTAAARLSEAAEATITRLTAVLGSVSPGGGDGSGPHLTELASLAATLPGLTAALQDAAASVVGGSCQLEAAGQLASGAIDTAGRQIGEAAGEVALQIDRLAGIAVHAETQAAVLPGITAQIAEVTGRLQALSDSWSAGAPAAADDRLAALPAAVARLEAALPLLEGLEALSRRLEHTAASLAASGDPAAATLAPALASLSAQAADLAQAINRVEAALSQRKPAVVNGAEPEALAATLQHLDGVASGTVALLQQSEALAEAVVSGRAPQMPPLLAGRTPALLEGVETTINRLRSVATALALASDGQSSGVRPQSSVRPSLSDD